MAGARGSGKVLHAGMLLRPVATCLYASSFSTCGTLSLHWMDCDRIVLLKLINASCEITGCAAETGQATTDLWVQRHWLAALRVLAVSNVH